MFAEEIKKTLLLVLKDLGIPISEKEIVLEHPAQMENGDYSTNLAMTLSAKLKSQNLKLKLKTQNLESVNPKEIADTIVKKWQEIGIPDFVEKVEVAGPGFINIWLKFDVLGRELVKVLNLGEGYGGSGVGEGRTVVIDYSAPNIAKPFGIGHLRSTNIGQSIYNLYQFCGWKTIGDNHLGDWGTQFGKLIYQIECKVQSFDFAQDKSSKACPEPVEGLKVGKEEFLKNLTIEELEKLYIEFHKEAETKPEMEEEARKWFKKLEEGDKEAKAIWQACIDISLKEFDRIYNLLGVKIDYAYGESIYLDKMGEVLEDCRKKGILKESQGAQVVEIPGMKIPAMLVKSDGATTYLLRDLATIKFRIREWQANLIVYEVGADQTLHFVQLFNIATQLGYGQLNQFVHIAHGLIRWSTGKFSTRRGETIHLEEVLNEAIEKAEKLCESAGVAKDLTSEERTAVAQKIGIGAIKYNDLKQNPTTDIVFDWDQILTLSGNSGPYLQYSFARTQSVLAKSTKGITGTTSITGITGIKGNNIAIQQYSNEEVSIMRTVYRFPEIIVDSAQTFSPNLLCNFLFDLAQKFNLFYDKQRIIGSENEEFRLLLTAAVGQVLKNGLRLLGIEVLEKM